MLIRKSQQEVALDLVSLVMTSRLADLISVFEIEDKAEADDSLWLQMEAIVAMIYRSVGRALVAEVEAINQKGPALAANSSFGIRLAPANICSHCLQTLGFVFDDRRATEIAKSIASPPGSDLDESGYKKQLDPSDELTIRLPTDDNGRLIKPLDLPEEEQQEFTDSLWQKLNPKEGLDHFKEVVSILVDTKIVAIINDPKPDN